MITVPEAIGQLLAIVEALSKAYPHKRFTLDGRLVGDLGEILAEEAYDIELLDGLPKHHDARTSDGRLVQIKATMQDALTFPADHVPEYYLGIQVHPDGTFSEVFNGPGAVAGRAVANRKHPKTNLHSISVSFLSKLNHSVQSTDRIPVRSARGGRRLGSKDET